MCLWALNATGEELLEPLNEAALLAPGNLRYALALANVWSELGCPSDAVAVLEGIDETELDCPGCRMRIEAIRSGVAGRV